MERIGSILKAVGIASEDIPSQNDPNSYDSHDDYDDDDDLTEEDEEQLHSKNWRTSSAPPIGVEKQKHENPWLPSGRSPTGISPSNTRHPQQRRRSSAALSSDIQQSGNILKVDSREEGRYFGIYYPLSSPRFSGAHVLQS